MGWGGGGGGGVGGRDQETGEKVADCTAQGWALRDTVDAPGLAGWQLERLPHLWRRDAQHQWRRGCAVAGRCPVLRQLALAPEEDGQVVLEDAAPARKGAGREGAAEQQAGGACTLSLPLAREVPRAA